MPRYIDAKQIRYSWMIDADGEEHDGVTLQSIIDKIPTADVVEVKHGCWIEYSGDPNTITCSECDWGTGVDEKFFKYCPNCGAIMDVKKEGICND